MLNQVGRVAPLRIENQWIVHIEAEQRLTQPRTDDMNGDQRRDQQTEGQLQGFPPGHAQGDAPEKCAQGQHAVHHEGAVQGYGAHRVLPDQGVDSPVSLHGVHRPQTEAVVDEVGNDVGRENQPRV